ncbi:alpha/beta hydrolase [Luteimonas sp. SX5]|uniref:Alpha/beta hydrolase n=1 Tax=Luteimonas galliterrae TaxID=2940486 RepID=A0ABT0MJE3_9GAMM|nr:alpha/beta hydrolase [Luteimonas galliterrae]MCL1634983.1 alpha/beta hydrolase [Luteimonas galliterrae]
MQRREFMGWAGGAMAMAAAGLPAMAQAASAGAGAAPAATTDAAAWNAARRFAKTRFGEIAYVDRGSGPAALFLHGFPLNGFQWRGAFDCLAGDRRRCIAPDFMGLGYTKVAAGQSRDPQAQVDMLLAFLDERGVDAVDLVANDSGGGVAQLFVVQHPQRVRSLLLTNCDTEPDCPPPALKPVLDLSREGKFVEQWLAPDLADKRRARSAQGLGGATFSFRVSPTDEAVDMYLGPLVRDPDNTHAYALGLERNFLAGIEPKLKASRVPTRIVWGMADDIFLSSSPDYLDRAFGASRGVRRIAEAKLFFPEEFPDLIAEEARKLWGVS